MLTERFPDGPPPEIIDAVTAAMAQHGLLGGMMGMGMATGMPMMPGFPFAPGPPNGDDVGEGAGVAPRIAVLNQLFEAAQSGIGACARANRQWGED